MPSSFEFDYPTITRWIKEFGRIEIGGASFADSFVKAVNRDGLFWGGKREYTTIDDALEDMEREIKELLEEQSKTSPKRTQKTRSQPTKRPRQTTSRSDEDQQRSEEEKKAIKKVEKLDRMAEELRQGGYFSVTRLTIVKSLCEDPKQAGAFALFLSRKIQQRMREKDASKRYRELVNRAVRELKPYLDEPDKEREERLWSLFHEIEAEQNEYENIPWGVVRNVKSFDLLVVEHALRGVLRRYEAPFWLYHAARDFTGKTDRLTSKSAPMVEDIARFWRKQVGIGR